MTPTKPLRGEVVLPGDKSISHRALMIAALADGPSRLRGLSTAADPRSTASCLTSLGIRVRALPSETIVEGGGRDGLRPYDGDLDCGNSGTTMRLLSGVLAGQPFISRLTGDASLRRRPMRRIEGPLTSMGAGVDTTAEGRPPLRIVGRRPLRPIEYVASVPSAQVKSAVLLAGLFADGVTSVVEPVPTRDHTERMLGLASQPFGQGVRTEVTGGSVVRPLDAMIPGDCSAAVFLIGAVAMVPGSEIVIRNVGVNPHRARVLEVLRQWGVSIEMIDERASAGEPIADLVVRPGEPRGPLSIAPSDVPALIDEIPALALTALSTGQGFSVSGATELRAKESDRIAVIVGGLRALGVAVDEFEDGFAFEGKNDVLAATVRTDGDHRIAMAFGMASLRHPSVRIDDPECVSVSFPDFFSTLRRLQGS